MNLWIKLAAVFAAAVTVAAVSGGAGATNAPTRSASASSKTAASSAAARRGALLRRADFKTLAGIRGYLRAVGVDPSGVVIQRAARNYAGPDCPGAGWACTSTAHAVVQVARLGGKNRFVCASASCAVIQTTAAGSRGGRTLAAPAASPPNIAKCVKTTGVTQSCSISQSGGTADNWAIVYESASKSTGLTQSASYTAQITQQATGSNMNKACVYQAINVDGSTTALRGKPVTVTLRAHQNVTITQDSFAGNSAASSANSDGTCADGSPLTQAQTLTSTAYGTGPITQLENDPADPTPGPNVSLVINQNQSAGYLNNTRAHGANTQTFLQQSNQVAQASGGQNSIPSSAGVIQTQSKPNAGDGGGGIVATVNQFSKDPSTISATQVEKQCELAEVTGTLPADPNGCFTVSRNGNSLPSILTQTQYGPIGSSGGPKRSDARRSLQPKKGNGPSVQGDNAQDTFAIAQTTTQLNDTGQDQHQQNLVQGDCVTSGTCNANQQATVGGAAVTQPTQSGKTVSTSINCTGAKCPATPIIDSGPTQPGGTTGSTSATFTFHDAYAPATFLCQLDGGGFSSCSSGVNYTVSCASSHTFSVEATDTAGDVTTPATFSWTVPICPPTIDSGPTQPTDTSFSAAFAFHDVHTAAAVPTFQCQLDGGTASDCSSGTASYTVSCGSHTFSVTAGDQYGDTSAATTYSWTVANICFDGSPGTNAPPATLGPYTMTAFGTDSQPACPAAGSIVGGVTDPAGTIGFSPALNHDLATGPCWATWSHGYAGDVYDSTQAGAADPTTITLTLPAGTNAFYLYAEPDQFQLLTVTATAQNGTTSGPIDVQGEGGAQYFGFYGTGGVKIASITVTTSDPSGFAVGEFGINTSS